MELISDYMLNDKLRQKLNVLTQKTFGFDFESWVNGGYFEGDYIPYSFLEKDTIVSNVSANRMHLIQNGIEKEYIQIGTVMTDEVYRKQGLARKLMEHVIREYEGKCDGIYLFADLNALDFYRKMGFTEGWQYQYRMKPEVYREKRTDDMFIPVFKEDTEMKQHYLDAVRHSAVNAALDQKNKFGLQLFYTADLSNVYYAKDIDCFVVMEKDGDTWILQSIISTRHIPLKEIVQRIGVDDDTGLVLGFAPCKEDDSLCEKTLFDGGLDYRFFYRGEKLASIQTEKLYFPLLSHA